MSYDLARLKKEIDSLGEPATNTTTKGRRLQDLTEYLLGEIVGVRVIDRNKLNIAKSEEKDLWVQHRQIAELPFNDVVFPVECKNENHPASAAEIRDFETKVRDSGGQDGLFVCAARLSGEPETRAHHAISMALTHGIRITVVTVDDLAPIGQPEQLVDLLIGRFTELRVNQGYTSI